MKKIFSLLVVSTAAFAQHVEIKQAKGPTLAYSTQSSVKIIKKDGLSFKDLNKNGKLDIYEDWRKPVDVRAADLAKQLSVQEIAGLMLYSGHQAIPARPDGYFAGTYNGKPFDPKTMDASELTDQQKKFLKEDNLRHVLVTTVSSPEDAAKWNNKIQAFCESVGKGIPANNSTDPRHGTQARAEFNAAAGGLISMWPSSLGMAATFKPELIKQFGRVAAQEYRALGIATALSPQVDIATEPRWLRFDGTFGESSKLSAAMAEAYCNGFQNENWGAQSVNAMVKHWPGGGAGEAGRDAHYANGKFAVYPGNNFNEHLIPFTEGAFKLSGQTKKAAAVMPYYTISWNQTKENVANNYNKYLVTDLLRKQYGYDGVVCTDWSVTGDHKAMDVFIDGKVWGVENLNMAERHYKILMAGADQFGGNNDIKPVLEAYQMGVKEHGEAFMRNRFEKSAVRLLLNIFRVGLFENPYLNPVESNSIVGQASFMKAGYDAQLKSIVMLKNKQKTLPIAKGKTVYIPKRVTPAGLNFFGLPVPESEAYPVNLELVKRYYTVTDDPAKADFAIVFINSPKNSGYSREDREAGGNGYVPINLQLKDYTASEARENSMAAGDPVVDPTITNRSYLNKTSKSNSYPDLNTILDTKKAMNGKPVLVAVTVSNPMVFGEFEKDADAIVGEFGVQTEALLDIISGKVEPSGLLPLQMPIDMTTVEKQFEDVPHDMIPYRDSNGNVYDFGFGLNWKGVIKDARTKKYSIKK